MQSLIPEPKVLIEVRKAVAETLRADEETIRPESSIVRDLGAESLDFLDINYRLEQTFGIRMARHFFLEHMEELFGEGTAIDEHGRLTERALALVKLRYREAIESEPGGGLDMDEIPALITVHAVTATVMGILDTLPERCSCGASAWRAEDGTHITCGSCGEAARFTNGDELIRQWLLGMAPEADRLEAPRPG